jgi:hypothetical protein
MLFNHEGTADMRRAVMPSGGRGDASANRRKLSARCCPHSGGARYLVRTRESLRLWRDHGRLWSPDCTCLVYVDEVDQWADFDRVRVIPSVDPAGQTPAEFPVSIFDVVLNRGSHVGGAAERLGLKRRLKVIVKYHFQTTVPA